MAALAVLVCATNILSLLAAAGAVDASRAFPRTTNTSSHRSPTLSPAGVPPLEDLSSTWQEFAKDTPRHGLGLPTANSLVGSVIADVNVFAIRSLTFPPYTQGPFSPAQRNQSRFGRLLLNDEECNTDQFQWTPYSFRRQSRQVLTEVRLGFDETLLMARASFPAAGFRVGLELFPEVRKYGPANCTEDQWKFPFDMQSDPPCWNWYAPRPRANESGDFSVLVHDPRANLIVVGDARSPAIVAIVLSPQSTAFTSARVRTGGISYSWSPPPSSDPLLIEYVAVVGDRSNQSDVVRRAQEVAESFSETFDAAISERQQQLDDAFTPGNTRYSGHLPVFVPADPVAEANVSRIYYQSVVSLLANERLGLPAVICQGQAPGTRSRVFMTGGAENSTTNNFFWDFAYAPTVLAMLDPATLKCMVQLFYQHDIGGDDVTAGWGIDWESGHSVGAWYAANDMALFKIAVHYVTVTGDTAFLNTTVDGVRIIDQMYSFATYWRKLTPANGTLADYGGAHNLLECVPSYIHMVASFNAADVWMMEVLSKFYASLGDTQRAQELASDATKLAAAVQTLYVAPDGVWIAKYPNGSSTVVRHVVDLVYVSEFMRTYLTPTQSQQMLHFATTELLTPQWMRAQSLSDPFANFSDRTDHGPNGSYDGWPAFVVATFARQGDLAQAEDFLRRTAFVTFLGPYGQAHGVRPPLPPYKPFEYTLFNEMAGAGFADTIITTIFGLQPAEASLLNPTPPPVLFPGTARSIVGTLRNVPWQGSEYTATTSATGVLWSKA